LQTIVNLQAAIRRPFFFRDEDAVYSETVGCEIRPKEIFKCWVDGTTLVVCISINHHGSTLRVGISEV
jgi:hypothetical protein